MNNLKKLLSSAVNHTRISGVRRENNSYIVLLYHSFGQKDDADYLRLRISPESFDEQMAYLREEKYEVLLLSRMVNSFNSGSVQDSSVFKQKNTVFITFDDGYLDNLELALPILRKYGFPATLFIATDYLYRKNSGKSYWEKWEYLTPEKIRELMASGIEIGSHSCSHKALASLGDFKIREEVSSSKKILEDIIKNKITLFSYPHGIFNKKIKNILRQEGYQAACSSISGFNTDKTDLFELKRIEVRGDDSLSDFGLKLKGCYNWLGYLQRVRLQISMAI